MPKIMERDEADKIVLEFTEDMEKLLGAFFGAVEKYRSSIDDAMRACSPMVKAKCEGILCAMDMVKIK